LDRMTEFYGQVFGLPQTNDTVLDNRTLRFLSSGASQIKLVYFHDTPVTAAAAGGPSTSTGIRYMTWYVDDIQVTVRAITDGGGSVSSPPAEVRPGTWLSWAADPEGNWIELLQLPPA